LFVAGPVWGAYAVDLAGINLIAHSIAPLLLVTVLVAFCVLRKLVDSSAAAMAGGVVDEEAGAGQVWGVFVFRKLWKCNADCVWASLTVDLCLFFELSLIFLS
jgi:hypothetical protein